MATTDIDELKAEVLQETCKLAAAYATRFAGNPEGELRAWLQVAARREAMVSYVYGEAERSYRLPEPRCAAGEVAWEAVTLIWQHEEVHTRFIEVRLDDGVLKAGPLAAEITTWLGAMEGVFLVALTGRPSLRQLLVKLAAHVGGVLAPGRIPGFARTLSELGPGEFFLLCAVLETTAWHCYARMEALASLLADRYFEQTYRSLQMENLSRELHLKVLDETFHEQAFEEMASWVVGDRLDPSLTARACAQRLAALLPRSAKAYRDPDLVSVITDGGLCRLFEAHGVPLRIETVVR